MGDYQFTKNSPTSFPLGRILGKVELGLAAYGITVVGGLLILLTFSRETLEQYVVDNPYQKDIIHFLSLPETDQLSILGLYLVWYIYELFLALLIFFGTKLLSLGALRVWMLLTIINCTLGLFTAIPLYNFIDNQPLFLVCLMAVYLYKLYSIYTIDLFLKEIVGRRRAAEIAAAAAAAIVMV